MKTPLDTTTPPSSTVEPDSPAPREQSSADGEILAILGGDQRVLGLLEIALTAYTWLPLNIMNWSTGEYTREKILDVIKSLGLCPVDIPWHAFPKRFHRNKPKLHLLRPGIDEEQYIRELIAANQDAPSGRAKKPAKATTGRVVVNKKRKSTSR